MTEPKEPSPYQTQPSIQDGGGKRRLSSDDNVLAKRPKLNTTEDIGVTSATSAEEHNMNVENDEPKASVQSQGEETATGNLQESPVLAEHATCGIAKSLYADTDGALSVTQTGPLDNVEYGDELANKGELEVNLDDKDVLTWRSQEGNYTSRLDEQSEDIAIQKDNDLDSEATDSLVPVEEEHYKQNEPSSNQTQPNVQDGDGERRLSSVSVDTKRLKLITNKQFCLKNVTGAEEHNMNVGNDELKASVQLQGEEMAQVNLQKNPELAQHTTSGIAKSLHADADNATEETAMRTSGDIIAHGDEDRSLIEQGISAEPIKETGLQKDDTDRDATHQELGRGCINILKEGEEDPYMESGSTAACESLAIHNMTGEEQNEDQQNQYDSTLPTTFNQSNDLIKGLEESNYPTERLKNEDFDDSSSSESELLDTEELTSDLSSSESELSELNAINSQEVSATLVPVEEEHYKIDFNCTAKYCIKVANSNLPEWDELPSVESFCYSGVRDLVNVIAHESNDKSIAEIRDIKSSRDDYFVQVFWYYTRQELRNRRCTNMKAFQSKYDYMKTTHMEIIAGTSVKGRSSEEDKSCICPGKIFDYKNRRIVGDTRKGLEWAKAI